MMMAILKDFRGRLDYKAERLKLAAQWGATHGSTKRAAMELSAYLFLPTARGAKPKARACCIFATRVPSASAVGSMPYGDGHLPVIMTWRWQRPMGESLRGS